MRRSAARSWQQSVRCHRSTWLMSAPWPRSTCHHAGPCSDPSTFLSTASPASVWVQVPPPHCVLVSWSIARLGSPPQPMVYWGKCFRLAAQKHATEKAVTLLRRKQCRQSASPSRRRCAYRLHIRSGRSRWQPTGTGSQPRCPRSYRTSHPRQRWVLRSHMCQALSPCQHSCRSDTRQGLQSYHQCHESAPARSNPRRPCSLRAPRRLCTRRDRLRPRDEGLLGR